MVFLKHDLAAIPRVRRWAVVWEGDPGVSYVGVANAAGWRLDLGIPVHYVTGYRRGTGALENTDWVTFSVPGSDAAPTNLLWQIEYSGPGAGVDQPCDLSAFVYKQTSVPEKHYGVAVTGFEHDTGLGNRFTTILYADGGASVEPLWRTQTDGALVGGDDSGLRLATGWDTVSEHGGDVYVTGRVQNSIGDPDMYTMNFTTQPVFPWTDPKTPARQIGFPRPGYPDSGFDIPESISFTAPVDDPNIVPPPPGWTGPGYNEPLPTLIVVGSGINSGTGEDWKIIRYVLHGE
jgi:hypothetical protein